ncbi:MAG: diadenylate cyclase CdaA [Candidatus Saganbacteria bacterium]|nr:diadenylate cyclase CdaA [Candidatus Saganbacteria bacterium]
MTLPLGIQWVDLIDILIVAFILYQVFIWLKGTAGMQLLRGLLIVFVIYFAAQQLGLRTLNWLMEKFVTIILIVIIIVFQPELRRALERLGRGKLLNRIGLSFGTKTGAIVRQIIDAVEKCSQEKIGGLIVLERNTGLNEFLESGVPIDSPVTEELLITILTKGTPLHDGAIIIQGDRIASAGCLLPLSESRLLDRRLGTRHRAAVGMSEQSDALVIVVSESTGTISVAENGYLNRFLTKELLEERLFEIYKPAPQKSKFFFGRQKKE